jgi:membrane protein implicated in regulation of membrane protease activity
MDGFFSAHVLWVLAGVAFLVAELATPGFVLLFFAIGAFAAALLAWLTTAGAGAQIVCFVAVSLAGVALLRRMFLRVFHGRTLAPGDAGDSGGDDEGVGRSAVATRAIAPGAPGEIKFRGSFWRAEAETPGEVIGEGDHVVIVGRAKGDAGAYIVRKSGRGTTEA